MIGAERDELLAWRDSGRLPDADLRILERELDHEESVLPAFPLEARPSEPSRRAAAEDPAAGSAPGQKSSRPA
jgi:hypothetical protein